MSRAVSAAAPALVIEHLVKRYRRVTAVRDVSLVVHRGSVHGLLGPNGSGKTTTLGCALGLLRPTSGRVEVLGVPARRFHRTRGRVATVFDGATLVPGLTVRQNLEYARRLLGHRGGRGVAEALELAGIATLAGERARSLSLGQARKVAIARALLGAPELFVLDEPLSGLDTKAVRSVLRLLRRLGDEGLTVVVSSHRMHEMETIVDEVTILMDGRVARAGPLAEILGAGGSEDERRVRGGGVRLRVRAAPADRAAELLARLEGVRVESREPVAGAAEAATADLHVVTTGTSPATICAALVEAGCAVSALAPERPTLHSVFEALLDDYAGEAPARRSA